MTAAAAAPLPRRAFVVAGLATLAAPTLSGCGAISAIGEATTPLAVYDLRLDPALGPRAAGRPLARALVVELPEVAGVLDNDRILIRPTPLEAQYLPGARWSDPVAPLVQGLIVRNLEDSGGLRFVGRRPVGAGGDFALIGTLSDFQAEIAPDGSARVRIRLNARLVRERDAVIIAARVFETSVAADTSAALPLVEAFNSAAGEVIPELGRWVLTTLGARLAA